MLPWVCAVIHHRGRQNVVKTSVTHSPAARVQLHCFYHILSHLNRRTATYPASRGYIFTVSAVVRKVASADSRSIFYRACAKFVTPFAIIKWREFRGDRKKLRHLWSATHDSRNALNRSRTGKKNPFSSIYSPRFLDGFERLSADRSYFSHDSSSHSENVASACRVTATWNLFVKQIHGWRHWKRVLFVLFNMARSFENVCETISD